jgi:catalase
MSPVEREHIVRAYTFELGKCYHQAIRERQLQCLANIDPVLCAQVATGLGLPTPEPTVPLADVAPSPALSQVGRTWPADGRTVGIVVDADAGTDDVEQVRREVFAAGMVPLVIAAHGGTVGDLTVQRTFATGRSVELDALLLAGAPAPAPDALPARDAKAGAADATVVDPRVLLLVQECWRHAKVIGGWGAGVRVLELAGVAGAAGVVTGDSPTGVLADAQALLAAHRVWDRFPASIS